MADRVVGVRLRADRESVAELATALRSLFAVLFESEDREDRVTQQGQPPPRDRAPGLAGRAGAERAAVPAGPSKGAARHPRRCR
jgi:hypothetical protein